MIADFIARLAMRFIAWRILLSVRLALRHADRCNREIARGLDGLLRKVGR